MILSAKRYVIIGAGAAGLSLCHALLERGVTDEIVVLDRKPAFTDDRTWCFWNVVPPSVQPSGVRPAGTSWEVVGADGQRAMQSSERRSYLCLRGLDFYAYVTEILRRHSNVTLKLGCPVDAVFAGRRLCF